MITTDDHIKRLVDWEIDITQGDTGALLAQAKRGTGLEEEVLLLAGHRANDGEPVESSATIADFLDGNVGLVNGYLAAQLRAREFLYDAANKETVLEVARANGLEVPPGVESAWDQEHAEISADAGFNVDGIEGLVRSEQAAGRLPGNLRWREHVNLEPLYWTQEEAGLAYDPPQGDLPPRHEERIQVR